MKQLTFIILFHFFVAIPLLAGDCANSSSPQRTRFDGSLDLLEQILSKAQGKKKVDLKKVKSARVPLFHLESLGRLYRDMPKGGKRIKKFFDEIKELEDAIGAYDLRASLLEKAQKKNLSAAKISQLESDFKKAEKQLRKILKKRDWNNGERIQKIRAHLGRIKWPSPAEDIKYLNSVITFNAQKLIAKIEDELAPLIRKKNYDYEALELGLHEFRRGIRWIALYLQAAKDVYAVERIDPKSLTEDELALYEAYHDNKYAQLGDPKHAKVLVAQIPYLYLTKYIHLIGKIKDQGESKYYLDKKSKQNGIEEEAKKLFEEFQEIAPLHILVENL